MYTHHVSVKSAANAASPTILERRVIIALSARFSVKLGIHIFCLAKRSCGLSNRLVLLFWFDQEANLGRDNKLEMRKQAGKLTTS